MALSDTQQNHHYSPVQRHATLLDRLPALKGNSYDVIVSNLLSGLKCDISAYSSLIFLDAISQGSALGYCLHIGELGAESADRGQ